MVIVSVVVEGADGGEGGEKRRRGRIEGGGGEKGVWMEWSDRGEGHSGVGQEVVGPELHKVDPCRPR